MARRSPPGPTQATVAIGARPLRDAASVGDPPAHDPYRWRDRRPMMTKTSIGLLASALTLALACGPNAESDTGDESGSGSGSGSDSGATTTPNPTTTSTTNTSAMSETGTTAPGDSTSTGNATTDADTSSGGNSESSSGDPPPASYPPCENADPPCPEPYDQCFGGGGGGGGWCTFSCMDAGECPEPSSGDAVPVCEGPMGNDVCMLDCSDGATCPDGMDCQGFGPMGQFMRCTWPPA